MDIDLLTSLEILCFPRLHIWDGCPKSFWGLPVFSQCNVKEVAPSKRLNSKALIYIFYLFLSWFHNSYYPRWAEGKSLLYLEQTLARVTWTFLEGILHLRWHKWSYLHHIVFIKQVVSVIGSTYSIFIHFSHQSLRRWISSPTSDFTMKSLFAWFDSLDLLACVIYLVLLFIDLRCGLWILFKFLIQLIWVEFSDNNSKIYQSRNLH